MELSFDAIFVVFGVMMLPLVEQELLTFPEYLRFPTVFSWFRVTRSFALCVCFVDRCLSFCTFSLGQCAFCSSIYGFWLPFWSSSYSYNRIYNWNFTPLLVVYSIIVLSSSITYRQIRNKTNVTQRVPLLQQKLLTQLEQPSSSSCFVEFALSKP